MKNIKIQKTNRMTAGQVSKYFSYARKLRKIADKIEKYNGAETSQRQKGLTTQIHKLFYYSRVWADKHRKIFNV